MTISLVTGADGFVGRYLVNLLISRGDQVIELINPKPHDNLARLQGAKVEFNAENDCRYRIPVDILDSTKIKAVISEYRPNEIYHLAGQSSPGASWERPAHTMRVNYEGSINLLEGVLEAKLNSAVVLASSSSIYAPNNATSLIDENSECNPSTPYGISKLAVDHLARIYHKAYHLPVFSARPFFLIGAMKVGDVCSDWARNIVSIERGNSESLSIGQVNGVIRDFLSIHDGVRGLALIASHGSAGESYNICSGVGIALNHILDALIKASPNKIQISINESKIRPIEELIKVGDNKKLRSLGWSQMVTIDDSINEILEYWRATY